MKIIVTGSLGNIRKPLAGELVEKGYSVIVSIEDVKWHHKLAHRGNCDYE